MMAKSPGGSKEPLHRLIHISSFILDTGQQGSEAAQTTDEDAIFEAFEAIKERFKAKTVDDTTIRFVHEGTKFQVRLTTREEYSFIQVGALCSDCLGVDKGPDEITEVRKRIEAILELLPGERTYDILIRCHPAFKTRKDAIKALGRFSEENAIVLSAGIVYGTHILARVNRELLEPSRELLLLPVTPSHGASEPATLQLIDDISHLGARLGKIDVLSNRYHGYGDIIEMVLDVANEHSSDTLRKLEESLDVDSDFGIGISKQELELLEQNMNEIMVDINNINSARNKIISILLDYEKSRTFIDSLFYKWMETPLEGFAMVTLYEKNQLMLEIKDYDIITEKLRYESERIQQILNTIKTALDISLNEISEQNTKLFTLLSLLFACFGIAGFLGEFMSYYGGGVPSPFSPAQGVLLFFIVTIVPTVLVGAVTYLFITSKEE